MTFANKIKELSHQYLADVRAPDITGFVDQLFHVAAETGTVACTYEGGKRLRFFLCPKTSRQISQTLEPVPSQAACIVEHQAARSVLRMICARLGVICKERAPLDISPYGAKAKMEYDVQDHKRWEVSFTNTPERHEFLIEAV